MMLSYDQRELLTVPRPFRFIAAWQDHPDFQNFLQGIWKNDIPLLENVENFRRVVGLWNADTFGHIGRRKQRLMARLKGIDRSLAVRYSISLVRLASKLRKELDMVLEQEESLWRQKACSQWFIAGDCNTKFFHASVQARRRANFVSSLKLDDGQWCSDQSQLSVLASSFYNTLFTSTGIGYGVYPVRGGSSYMRTMNEIFFPLRLFMLKNASFKNE
ncbi:hypothetical protein GQ457_08G035730 [Hibiscus cannabinus]